MPAEDTAAAAHSVGMTAATAQTVAEALAKILQSAASSRILICGSLYLAGQVLRQNG